ncbi:hypothetical protein FNV43_RR09395 [Rhamnella rubrinervis]|uniref:Glycosyltransferase n=1 Tax=Rhamnella rubrinervis TaxID=2594499 RepID=A0A8K0H9W3_9ROSA|nr:hypothetical protein FNV43_RR09395 [Rhamnella rubrinervis]
MGETRQEPPNVAVVPTPGMGHLIPLVELARRLVVLHKFAFTFIVPSDGSPMEPQKKLLQGLPAESISSIFLPHLTFHDLPEDSPIEARIASSLIRSLPALRDSLKVLNESTRLVALVVDLFGAEALDLAKEFGVLPYVFFPSSMMVLSSVLYLPKLDESTYCEYRDLPEPIGLPGCVPINGSDLADVLQDRKNEAYKMVLGIAKRYSDVPAGIMVNSFADLEPGAFKASKDGVQLGNNPPVYSVGPLIRSDSAGFAGFDGSEYECLRWLDKQPKGSVLFISFGSGGTLSHEQLKELALGLEMSGQRFLWVVRRPNEKAANANYFNIVQSVKDYDPDYYDFLPNGFLERTKEVGLVVPNWAPQVRVLNHVSTGGFVCHCGWNSVLESIVHGVPLIAWPLYAEQRMNTVLLVDDLKVAFRVKLNEKGLVERQDIAKYAKELIEGEDGKILRSRIKHLKDAASLAMALSKQAVPAGSSTNSLAEVAQIWNNHHKNLPNC